jgi:hypothetical protein
MPWRATVSAACRALSSGGPALACCLLLSLPLAAGAQELSPRAFWPGPTGISSLTVGYAHTEGDTVTDPSLPIEGVNSRLNTGLLAYRRTFGLAGRTANFLAELPYVDGLTTADLVDTGRAVREFSGLGDLALTVSANLIGAPEMDREEFADWLRDPGPLIGVSMRVVAPTGAYDKDRVINVSANRWAVKPKVGATIPLGDGWLIESQAGIWFFGDNDDFLGQTKSQRPLRSFELNLVHRFRRGLWGAISGNYFEGGRTQVGSNFSDDIKRNWTLGATVSAPLGKGRLFKVSMSTGKTLEQGNAFNEFVVSFTQILP